LKAVKHYIIQEKGDTSCVSV